MLRNIISELVPLHEDVPLEFEGRGCPAAARVHVIGAIHLKKFASQLTRAVDVLSRVTVPKSASQDERMAAIGMAAAPIVTEHLAGLLDETVTLGLMVNGRFEEPERGEGMSALELPHFLLPQVIDVWLRLNFLEVGKWKPWLDALESVLARVTGKEGEAARSIQGLFSNSSSPPDTAPETSSTTASPECPTPAGRSTS